MMMIMLAKEDRGKTGRQTLHSHVEMRSSYSNAFHLSRYPFSLCIYLPCLSLLIFLAIKREQADRQFLHAESSQLEERQHKELQRAAERQLAKKQQNMLQEAVVQEEVG